MRATRVKYFSLGVGSQNCDSLRRLRRALHVACASYLSFEEESKEDSCRTTWEERHARSPYRTTDSATHSESSCFEIMDRLHLQPTFSRRFSKGQCRPSCFHRRAGRGRAQHRSTLLCQGNSRISRSESCARWNRRELCHRFGAHGDRRIALLWRVSLRTIPFWMANP